MNSNFPSTAQGHVRSNNTLKILLYQFQTQVTKSQKVRGEEREAHRGTDRQAEREKKKKREKERQRPKDRQTGSEGEKEKE